MIRHIYLNNKTLTATRVYASKVPMDIMSTSSLRSNIIAMNPVLKKKLEKYSSLFDSNKFPFFIKLQSPANSPERSVPATGVLNLSLTVPRN